jgi:MYXO-CTERM domain-containing protein
MRSPARLVTGTAAAALTAAALGLAIPSAHADSLGGPGLTAAADCAAGEGSADMGAAAFCESGGAAEDLWPLDDLEAGDPGPADGPDPLAGLETTEDPAAVPGSSWPETETEEEGGTGTGDEAGALQRPGTGAGTAPGTGNRPEPVPPHATDPGSAKPPVPPGHRPTTAPSRPSGHVGTGVGGSTAPDTAQLAAGAGLVGAAALGGLLLIRRRRADGPRH